eukprot:CAMPEP_0116030944 /NCGR_PEP_ID=MMETSP0321-20121206/17184_1 /TAXON_ID=163516 /ORGANISM="Leptocylindrus danicus var. danicus, Strain B650" /LENGTH=174 /DNA_ID=CAMNT_0003505903 /DNA_START=201 /DNA_END=725 /DNA_ORIENTATION=-
MNGTQSSTCNSSAAQKFLLKSEPQDFSIADLKKCYHGEDWTGVRNFEARNILKEMKIGDECFFYHSSCKPAGIVGVCRVIEEAKADLTALDPKNEYYDPKSSRDKVRWCSVKVEFVREFKEILSLQEIKNAAKENENSALSEMALLKRSRLSVSRVTDEQWDYIFDLIDEKGLL